MPDGRGRTPERVRRLGVYPRGALCSANGDVFTSVGSKKYSAGNAKPRITGLRLVVQAMGRAGNRGVVGEVRQGGNAVRSVTGCAIPLRCLATGSCLREMTSDECTWFNTRIAAGELFNYFGQQVMVPLEAALIDEQGHWGYRIISGIPQMLRGEALCLTEDRS